MNLFLMIQRVALDRILGFLRKRRIDYMPALASHKSGLLLGMTAMGTG